ncbi:MAG: flagellar basal body P-ring protein FlgI [candidate division FCPU426 bacterium]
MPKPFLRKTSGPALWMGLGIALCCWTQAVAVEVKLGDMVRIQGLRENQVLGYGVVVGLQGTGDSRGSWLTSRSLANMLEKFGLNFTERELLTRNAAAVMVTATLNPFVREGDRVDVNIASVGDAKSLQGGTLLLTSLAAGNQKTYASAQGPVSVGGYYTGTSRQSIQKNITTVGVIPGGAIVEQAVDAVFLKENRFIFNLERTDFVLANQVVTQLVKKFGLGTARTVNGTDIEISIPDAFQPNPVGFIAEALQLTVEVPEAARVVIDERTGTVVIGGEVRISKAAVSHGGLHIAISGETKISQPLPLTLGHTVVAEELSLRADERERGLMVLPEGTTIEELVRALNAVGTLPRDTVVILENLKALGALHAQVLVR